jgi:hypothetical protein
MRSHRSVLLSVLALAVLVVAATGCRQLAGYEPAVIHTSFHCDAEVGLLPDVSPDPDLSFDYLGLGKPLQLPEVVRFANGDRPVELYRSTRGTGGSAPWIAQGVIPPVIRGTWLVRLDFADRTVSGPLVRIDFNQPAEVDTVWIGFDTRATEPDWVRQSFDRADETDDLETTLRTSTDDPVRFRFWRLKESVDLGRTLELGGNDDPTAVWPEGEPGDQYLVFVRQKPVPNTGAPMLVIGRHTVEKCSENQLADVQQSFDSQDLTAQLMRWKAFHLDWTWAYDAGLLAIEGIPGSCREVEVSSGGKQVKKFCSPGEEIGSNTYPVNDWRVVSTAALDSAASEGRVSLDGGGADRTALEGRISFANRPDGILELDEISLWAEPFSSGGLDVAWTTFGQLGTVEAECLGQSFPHTLCDGYRIGDGGLELFGVARVGDYRYSTTLVNEGPVDLEVDLSAREFGFVGGPFEGAVRLEDGSELQVSAELEVLGRFVNFAPVPLTDEGDDRFPCLDNRVGRVRLDAGASIDAEGSIVDHLWIEDAGASSQRVLGQGPVVEVDLGLGHHDITLVVEDADGTRAFTRGLVEVFDDEIDSASFPPDVWAPTTGSGATWVDPGTATGADACAGGVFVADNGPADRLFPDGLSLIDWVVDDGNGHVVRDRQTVLVVPAAAGPPPDAWVAPDPIAAAGDVLRIDAGTRPMGNGVVVDEYLLITAPDGEVWSVDARGALRPPGRLAARARGVIRGLTSTSDQIRIDEPGRLGEDGLGGVELVLVLPGGDPLDREQIVGWDGAAWRLVR